MNNKYKTHKQERHIKMKTNETDNKETTIKYTENISINKTQKTTQHNTNTKEKRQTHTHKQQTHTTHTHTTTTTTTTTTTQTHNKTQTQQHKT